MKKKQICRIVVDLLMTVLLLFLMARQITGDSAHEWLGAGMFVLWIAHHCLNRKWYGHLFKGKYRPVRILHAVANAALFLSMLGLMISGLILLRIAAALIAGYGVYVFLKNELLSYMFLTLHFVFFDYEKPVPLFFAEYMAMMWLFVFLAYYISRGLQKVTEK